VDRKEVQVRGGNGGDGCISLAHLFANENAGPDGGDGGNGGRVFFKVLQTCPGYYWPVITIGLIISDCLVIVFCVCSLHRRRGVCLT